LLGLIKSAIISHFQNFTRNQSQTKNSDDNGDESEGDDVDSIVGWLQDEAQTDSLVASEIKETVWTNPLKLYLNVRISFFPFLPFPSLPSPFLLGFPSPLHFSLPSILALLCVVSLLGKFLIHLNSFQAQASLVD
jgi:hypothetical protein